jgi:hypothetical protein
MKRVIRGFANFTAGPENDDDPRGNAAVVVSAYAIQSATDLKKQAVFPGTGEIPALGR